MNLKKKVWAILLVAAMIIASLMPGFAMLANADGDEPETVAASATASGGTGEDISSKIITGLKIIESPNGTTDVSGKTFQSGKYLYVHCEFDEGNTKQIHDGDTIRVTWPGNPKESSCYLSRSTITEDFIDGDGDKLGEIVYSHHSAIITFNKRASEKLDVEGSFKFKVRAENSKDDTTGSVTVKAGNIEKSFKIHRGKGGTRGRFWTKMGAPIDDLNSNIVWDLAVNGSYNEVTSDVNIIDKIADGHNYAGNVYVYKCHENKETRKFEYFYMDSLENYNRGKSDNQKIRIDCKGKNLNVFIPKEAFEDDNCAYGYSGIIVKYATKATPNAKENEQSEYSNKAWITTSYLDDSNIEIVLNNAEEKSVSTYTVDHVQDISSAKPGELKVFKYVIGARNGKKDRPLAGVSFDVYKANGEKVGSFTTGKDGIGSITRLRTGKYKIVETGAPDWVKFDKNHPRTIENIDVSADVENKVISVGNSIKDEKFNLEIEKKWIGTPKERAGFMLFVDGEYRGDFRTVTKADNWKCTFENLPKYRVDYKEGRKKINYVVKEIEQLGVSQTSVEGSIEEGKMTFTNTSLKPLWVYKKWIGQESEQVTVKLLKDGKDTGKTVVLSKSNRWQDCFRGIPETELNRYTVKEVVEGDYKSTIQRTNNQFLITNTYKWPVKFNKFDETSGNSIQLENAKLKLSGKNIKDMEISPGEIINLLPGTYKLSETEAPKGYKKAKAIEFTVAKDGMIAQKDAENKVKKLFSRFSKKDKSKQVKEVTMYDSPETKEIKVSKIWDDEDNRDGKRPKKLKVTLKANGKQLEEVILSSNNRWKHEFKNLPLAKDGNPIDYDVMEESVEGYTSSKKEVKEGFEFTNKYKPGRSSVSVSKEWHDKDNQDGLRPDSIKVQLMANNEPYGDKVELKKGEWSYTWKNLPLNENGKPIKYEINEDENIPNYTLKAISGNEKEGFRIINEHIPETLSISGKKTWKDNDNPNRPDAHFILKADGTEIKDFTGKADYSFNGLPKYKAGKEIKYTVEERAINGYHSERKVTEKGFDFINTRTGTTKVDVKKIWKDPEGTIHPEVTINLLANGEAKESIKLSNEKGWNHTFSNLEKYDENGKEIEYSVKEEAVKNYKSSVSGNAKDGFVITNTITGKKDIPVKKTWQDPKGTKHPAIEVELFDITEQDISNPDIIDNVPIKKLVLNDSNGFEGMFTNLDKYTKDGREKLYGIHEEPLEGYWDPEYRVTTINGKDGMEIINTINGEVNFTLKKEWEGPKKDATILLHGTSGEKKVDGTYDVDFTYEYDLNAENQYRLDCWVFKYDYKGREINYTLSEKNIENYKLTDIVSKNGTKKSEDGQSIRLTDDDTVTFKNKNTETVDVPVEKIWKDEETSHPDVKVKLLVSEEAAEIDGKTITLTEKNKFKGKFKNLPKYDNEGRIINYAVEEVKGVGYNTSVTGNVNSGYVITNTKAGKLTLGVTKKWIGKPVKGKYKVQLYRNIKDGELEAVKGASFEFDEKNTEHNFENLPETNSDGKKYTYTVKELTKPGKNDKWEPVSIKKYGNTFVVTNRNKEKTSLNVEKVWKDPKGTNHPEITIELLADGKPDKNTERVVFGGDKTKYTFKELPKYDSKDGHEIKYSAREVKVPEGYTGRKTVKDGKVLIVNTKIGKRTFRVNKKWVGPATDGVEVQLYKMVNGKEEPVKDDNGYNYRATLNSSSKWTVSFPEVDRYDKEGQEIGYLVKEIMPKGTENKYETATVLNGDTFTVTNANNETVNVPVEKKWNGKKQTATFKLYADGELYEDEKAISIKDNGEAVFKDLPKYKDNGKLIDYTVKEEPIDGYRSEMKKEDGKFKFTNTEITSVTVNKKWDGPVSVAKIRLYADGTETDKTCTLTKDNETFTFKDLDKYQKDNKTEIEYTVKEEGCENYEHVITGDAKNGFNITNTWLCPFKVNKFENEEDKNLNGVELKLYKGVGKDKTFYKDINQGELYMIPKGNYTLVEAKCPVGYKKAADIEFSIRGKDGITINNKFNISSEGQVKCGDTVTGMAYQLNKTGDASGKDYSIKRASKDTLWNACSKPRWNKEQGSDGYKKDMQRNSIIQVIEAGYPNNILHIQEMYNLTDKEFKEVTQDAIWYYTSTYNVEKEKIDNEYYTNNQKEAFYVLTSVPESVSSAINLYIYTSGENKFISTSIAEIKSLSMYDEPEKITVKGNKIWDDNKNQDGKRPEEITINLLANGRKVDSKTITESDKWECEFNVPGYHNGKKINYTVTENAVKNYNTEITGDVENGFQVKNSYTPQKTSLNVTKVWDDNDNQDGKRPETIKIKLLANGKETDKTVTLKEDNKWIGTFANLDMYKDGKKIKYSVKEDKLKDYEAPVISGDMVNGFTIINTHKPETTRLSYEKIWKDNSNQDGIRPKVLNISLIAIVNGNENVVDVANVTNENLTGVFENLPVYENGKKITYKITEENINGYTSKCEMEDGKYTFTNVHTPETIKYEGLKYWEDENDKDGFRPESVTISLLANGEKVKDLESVATADTGWRYSFENLPKFKNGKEIEYAPVEEKVPEHYEMRVAGTTVFNKHVVNRLFIGGQKIWKDDNDRDGLRPDELKIKLLGTVKDEIKVERETILYEKGNWTYAFTDLPEYIDGEKITYKLVEPELPEGYTSKADEILFDEELDSNSNITNTHNLEIIEISGKKTWDDEDDRDGKRPEKITVNLLANGEKIDSKEVTSDSDWKYEFKDLYKFQDGEEIKYTVTEDMVAEYTPEYSEEGIDIKNRYTPGKTSVTVNKEWEDGNNIDKIRPKSVKVQLYKNGEKYGDEIILNAEKGWTYVWKDLYTMEDGKKIEYTVKEVEVAAGYKSEIEGDSEKGFTILNRHKPKEPEKDKGEDKNIPPSSEDKNIEKPGGERKTGDSNELSVILILISACSGLLAVLAERKKKNI